MRLEVDGCAVAIYTGAREAAPGATPVLLLHGAGQDHTVWSMHARYLAHHGWAALAPDLPGHGGSAGPPLASVEALADWSLHLLDAAGFTEEAVLVGHSLGALVALAAAARRPEGCATLVLLGASAPMPVAQALLDAARDDPRAAIEMITGWGHGPRGRLGGNESPGAWILGTAIRLLERSGPGVLATDLGACNAYADGLDAATRVRCPAWLVIGEADRMTPPRASEALAGRLPEVRIRRLPGCGHMLMAEQPNAVIDVLVEALAGIRESGARQREARIER